MPRNKVLAKELDVSVGRHKGSHSGSLWRAPNVQGHLWCFILGRLRISRGAWSKECRRSIETELTWSTAGILHEKDHWNVPTWFPHLISHSRPILQAWPFCPASLPVFTEEKLQLELERTNFLAEESTEVMGLLDMTYLLVITLPLLRQYASGRNLPLNLFPMVTQVLFSHTHLAKYVCMCVYRIEIFLFDK